MLQISRLQSRVPEMEKEHKEYSLPGTERSLRVHHLLCIPMYSGRGYSDEFCRNMQEMIAVLKEPATEVKLVHGPDVICSACPNLTRLNTCRDDSNRVVGKDDYLAEALKLNQAGAHTFQEYEQWVGSHITEEIFHEACRTCRWLEAGLCSFDKLKEGIENIRRTGTSSCSKQFSNMLRDKFI